MKFTKDEMKSLAQEMAERSSSKVTTILFTDGTITTVCGPYQANKPVWVEATGKIDEKKAYEYLLQTHDEKDW